MMKSRAPQLMLIATLFIHMPEMTRAQGLEQQTIAKIELGAGIYTTEEIVYIQGNSNRTDSDAKFKGKGLTGGLIGKFFKSGKRTTLVDLDEGMMREIDRKKKKCVMRDMTIMADTLKNAMNSLKDARKSWEEERSNYDMSKSDFEIIESVFEVKELGDAKKLNNFQCSHYGIKAYTVRQHVSNGATMVDSMYIDTWVTPLTDELKQAKEIQQAYAMAFAEKMGLSETFDEMRESFLGGKWLQMFRMTGGGELASDRNYEDMATEMQKLENKQPIQTSGRFYLRVITPAETDESADADAAPSDDDIKSVDDLQDQAAKGMSGFAKGLFGKKKKEEPTIKPIFSFETENKSVKITELDQVIFTSEYECKTEN